MSEEIIKILDDLGNRLGIAIDWTSNNVMPYLQDLMQRFIGLKNTQALIWIIISLVIILVIALIIVKTIKYIKKQEKSDYEYEDKVFYIVMADLIIGFIALAFAITMFCNIFGLLQNIYTPEITIINYITSHGGL